VYFRLCRVPRVVGLPLAADLAAPRGPDGDGLWESETARLARCLAPLGDPRLADPASWSLDFTAAERAEADRVLAAWPGRADFAALGIGTKQPQKDWGEANWRTVLEALWPRRARLGLAFVGDAEDAAAAARVSAGWGGPVANLCGALSPRVSALVIARARLFMGLDSGPMHLAASVGVPAVAVFGTQSRPGVWFPHGARHRVLYPGLAWSGGDPPVRRDAAGEEGIAAISPLQAIAACESLLARKA
jgi:ADP-heptose:LPS heptosyltransferase